MKKLNIIFKTGLFIILFSITSCNYLEVDKYFTDMLTEERAFQSKQYTEQWLWNTYSWLQGSGREIATRGNTAFSFASDEAVFSDWGGGLEIQQYQNGEYNESTQIHEDRWGDLYRGIRKASTFIYNVDNCEELNASVRQDYKAQARFLRAYFYWMLLKQYGPVPIIKPDEGADISLTYEELEMERTPFDECVDYITTELLTAARTLPKSRQANWLGQATAGAALATRAKVLLYAASPLYNGNTDYYNFKNPDGTLLINQVYDEEKWAKAAAAAKDVINLGLYELNTVPYEEGVTKPLASNVPTDPYPNGAGNIDPFESYRQTFNGEVTASNNRELIFVAPESSINDMVKHFTPKQLTGWNCFAMTLKQLDAYYMFDGKDIHDATAEVPYSDDVFTTSSTQVPFLPAGVNYSYAYREPRFYASASYNGVIWENKSTTVTSLRNKQIFYYKGRIDGKNDADIEHYVLTGLGIKKFYNPLDSWSEGGQRLHKVEPRIRYADVLLWYAEALNNLTQSYTLKSFDNQIDITVSRDVNEMRFAISRIRFRAGLPDYSEDVYASRTEFYTALKRERQIELFIESARYFDLRRWKDAEVEEALPLWRYSVDVTASSYKDFYTREPLWVKKRFGKEMYLWPLPLNELRRNSKLVQNPGWE
ncbi:RagB/SusD family nutrient uptake outer membrane protein [Saccharicrinis sp. FJH62]|uniref:RagB/SusD family nutrient uptake outer membrane protein n=1 Tax=Saccharicrinis sp. FJH62 TaxID=3344657 RepID=UPI0035D4C0DA